MSTDLVRTNLWWEFFPGLAAEFSRKIGLRIDLKSAIRVTQSLSDIVAERYNETCRTEINIASDNLRVWMFRAQWDNGARTSMEASWGMIQKVRLSGLPGGLVLEGDANGYETFGKNSWSWKDTDAKDVLPPVSIVSAWSESLARLEDIYPKPIQRFVERNGFQFYLEFKIPTWISLGRYPRDPEELISKPLQYGGLVALQEFLNGKFRIEIERDFSPEVYSAVLEQARQLVDWM